MPEYRYHSQPGCGGCLLVFMLGLLLFGGGPLLFEVMGFLLVSALFFVFFIGAAVWLASAYIRRKVSNYEQHQSEARNRFVQLLVYILMKIAQIDGIVTRVERQTIQNYFQYNLHYGQEQMFWVKQLMKDGAESTESLESLLEQFRNSFSYEPRLILVELIFQVLHTKKEIPAQELELVQNIADYLDISTYDQQTIWSRYRYQQQGRHQPRMSEEGKFYEVLGLSPGADFATIKSAYRKLSMKYHPDKVGHLGEEFRKVAEEKMKDINVAYDFFRKKQ